MWIDKNKQVIIKNLGQYIRNNNILTNVPRQKWSDEATINSAGIYTAILNRTPYDSRYQSSTDVINYDTATVTSSVVDLPLDAIKSRMIASVKSTFNAKQVKPIIDTGLGFSVDGGYDKIKDFEIGKKYSFPSARASDNTFHAVTDADYDTIISAIELYGIQLFQTKWAKEEEIALLDLQGCKDYEKTPYDYLEPIESFTDTLDADGVTVIESAKDKLEAYGITLGIDLNKTYTLENMYQQLVDSGLTETRYKNLCTDWDI